MNNPFIYNIRALLKDDYFGSQNYSVEFLGDEIQSNQDLGCVLTQPLTGTVKISKTSKCIEVVLLNFKTNVLLECARCLTSFKKNIEFNQKKYLFFQKIPSNKKTHDDVFLINNKKLTINIKDAVCQELIMSIPSSSICSKSCKGFCLACLTDLNKNKCKCQKDDISENKPFSILKKLIK